jgi:hypothetical protein
MLGKKRCCCGTPSTPCSPCAIPLNNLSLTIKNNTGGVFYTGSLTYTPGASPTWVSPAINNPFIGGTIVWTLSCTGGSDTLLGSIQSGTCMGTVLDNWPLSTYTCSPFHLQFAQVPDPGGDTCKNNPAVYMKTVIIDG